MFGRAYNRFEEQITHVDRIGYWDYVHFPSRQLMGGIGFFENNNGENWQFNSKTTFNFSAAGEHTWDFGYMYEDVKSHRRPPLHRSHADQSVR